VIGEHQLDLGAAEARQAFGTGEREIVIELAVDDLGRGFERALTSTPIWALAPENG